MPSKFKETQILLRDGNKPLHALALKDFASINVAFGIHSDHVKTKKLAAVFTHSAYLSHDCAVLPIQKPDMVVRQVGDIQESLLFVG